MKGKIVVINDKGFIFSAEDAIWLRKEHRIVGTAIGCFPPLPKQNLQLSIPVQLMPEEVTLLVEKGLGELSTVATPLPLPTQEEITEFCAYTQKVNTEQLEQRRVQEQVEFTHLQEVIAAGQIVKLSRRLERGQSDDLYVDLEKDTDKFTETEAKKSRIDVETEVYSSDDEFEASLDTSDEEGKDQSLVHLSNEPWRGGVHTSVNWNYPNTATEHRLYTVFKDLWLKGYYLTRAVRFGGDFLVYPGDPGRYHSFFIAKCLDINQKLSLKEIACLGRLGTTVKKVVLLCGVSRDNNILYKSLKWTHIN